MEQEPPELQRSKQFYDTLEASILEKGFINPILINAGFCPPISVRHLSREMRQDASKILVCCKWGGSRLYIAQKHKLDVPCLISDFIDRYDEPELTLSNVKSMLHSIREIVITDVGLWVKE